LQSLGEVHQKLGKRPFDPAGPPDQHMVRAFHPGLRQPRPRQFAQPPLHPVADDGIADLLRDGEPDPHRGIVVAARADEQDEAGGRGAPAAIGREEIRAAPKRFDRLSDGAVARPV